jgi:hypothetical protein
VLAPVEVKFLDISTLSAMEFDDPVAAVPMGSPS